jgi:hypothetical protein
MAALMVADTVQKPMHTATIISMLSSALVTGLVTLLVAAGTDTTMHSTGLGATEGLQQAHIIDSNLLMDLAHARGLPCMT